MNTVAIDRKTLNGLFDNQKKLDDLFESIFDDDNLFANTPLVSAVASRHSTYDSERSHTYSSSDDYYQSKSYGMRSNPYFFLLPIGLEIAAIYLIVTNFL